ncbi:MAG TPA: TetR/AcrR family transcriptional regulator [Caulobacteraceae bacterium]|nr:TetR/AcrR family transcriptional regulator [Caulobacteraceae bacterium]
MRTESAAAENKPYHHGDLRRALLEAAQTVLEREGPGGLSLRAVAREAGVSPAAPYHHFKDKDELMLAVGKAGFGKLNVALGAAATASAHLADRLSDIGMAYVEFAQDHPATYQVMYDCARRVDAMPDSNDHDGGGFEMVKDAIKEAAGGEISDIDVHLAAIASWCAVHGLAEMSGFAEFKSLKAQLGGEKAFLRGVLSHIMSARGRNH